MTKKEIAARLADLCRQGQFETAQKELYAENAISIEPYDMPDFPKETKGLPGIIEKGHKFQSTVETIHSLAVSEPLVVAGSFAVTLQIDMTAKEKGRMDMSEICVYNVKDGKIISEEFFV
ncbi:MAG: SnoaL-like domain-containing protein [Ferruginibacter sp.]